MLVKLCDKGDMKCLPITCEHALNVQTLKRLEKAPQHKDPFDRLLIAQAKYEGMVLITHDGLFEGYNEECILKI